MVTIETIKNKVREFQKRTNFGRTDEDNFTPWWIQQKFKTSDEEATMCSSDGNYDKGLDGYFLQETQDRITLTLVQGKYTEDLNQIKKGVSDINRFLPDLGRLFKKLESDSYKENIVIKRIRPRIEGIKITDTKPLYIEACVIGLTNLSPEFIENKISTLKSELGKTFLAEFDNPNIIFDFKVIGLEHLIENNLADILRPARPFEIHFDGSEELEMGNSKFVSGLGKLSDLVDLYNKKGNQLFDKNVRLFLYGKKNESKGPAGKIKETLELINSGKFGKEKFAFLHNGVSIYSTKTIPNKDSRSIEITNPSILNGCQTIKSASFFYQEMLSKGKLDEQIWKNIPVSVRIVSTNDAELWREVAEANNRQNSMSPAALRANDEVQINLENDFKDLKIFYERQEAAFENISRVDRDKFEELYSNSLKEPIYIDTLAQTIICCSDLALSYATRANEIFESQKLYLKVFSRSHLYDLKFLILAHNVRRVVEYAVRNAIPGNATKVYADFRPSKYRDLFTRLVLKVIIKNKELEDYVEEYGNQVLSGQGTMAKNLIEELRGVIKSPESPILQKVCDVYRVYDKESEQYSWVKQDNPELHTIITNKLRLNNVNVFEGLS